MPRGVNGFATQSAVGAPSNCGTRRKAGMATGPRLPTLSQSSQSNPAEKSASAVADASGWEKKSASAVAEAQVAKRSCGSSDPPQSRGDLPAHIWAAVVPFLLHHLPQTHVYRNSYTVELRRWSPTRHYGHCGQSCPCCRSHNPEDAHPDCNCEQCYLGWVLTTVSRQACATTQAYAASWSTRG